MWGEFAAEVIRQVDHPRGFSLYHGAHDVFELGHITPHDPDCLAHLGKRRPGGVDVHADHFFPACHQPADNPWADETRAPDDEYRHVRLLRRLAPSPSRKGCAPFPASTQWRRRGRAQVRNAWGTLTLTLSRG